MTSTAKIDRNRFIIVVDIDSTNNEFANLQRRVGNTQWFIVKEDFFKNSNIKLEFVEPDGTVNYYTTTNDKKVIKLGYLTKRPVNNKSNVVKIESNEDFKAIFKRPSLKNDQTRSIRTPTQSGVMIADAERNQPFSTTENESTKRMTDVILKTMLEQIDLWEKMFKSLKTCDVSLILKPSNQTKVIKIKNKIASPKPIIKKVKFNEVDDADVNYKKTPKLITTCDGKEDCKCRKWWGRTIRDDSNCGSDILDDDDKRVLQFCSYSCAATREEDLYAYEN